LHRLTITPGRTVGGEIVDPDVDVEAEALARIEAAILHRRLDLLPEIERRTLIWSFGLNGVGELTLREIGLRLGCSESNACRIRARALTRLRRLYRETSASANGAGRARSNGRGGHEDRPLPALAR
jgi:DNA-directed RNA polymerase specialized sigma subunit